MLISSVPELRTGWLDGLPARLAVEVPAPGAEEILCHHTSEELQRLQGTPAPATPSSGRVEGHAQA